MKIVAITGHGTLTIEEFLSYYKPKIDYHIKQNSHFRVGDFRGCDTITLEYLKDKTSNVTVYHQSDKPKINIDTYNLLSKNWKYSGNYKTFEESDLFMISGIDDIIGWVNPNQINTFTERNINLFNSLTKTQIQLYRMITENTGRNMLDSGDIYGRHWERNINRNIFDFIAESAESFKFDGEYLYRTVSTFHWLSQLELDEICDIVNELNTGSNDSDIYGVDQEVDEWLNNNYRIYYHPTANTYNFDSDLSQVVQYTEVDINESRYVFIQIHQGCDIRGGYTKAVLFKLNEEGLINSYLDIYLDKEELINMLKSNDINNVFDYYDDAKIWTNEEILKVLDC
jgi:hypothetical protein